MLSSSQSIRDIAADQPSAIALFERFEIDVCSLADKSLKEACSDLHLSLDQVLEKLQECHDRESGAGPSDPSTLSCAHLIQHIVRVHHQRVRHDLPSLVRQARKLTDKLGDQAREFKAVEKLIERLQQDLWAHIRKEEEVLFPFIVRMEEESTLAYPPAHACFRSISHPVFMMVQEHEAANLIMEEIRWTTGNFTPPEWACPTHRALFDGLRGFECDLREHVHIENDVLFPRSIQMEAELRKRE
jgi:regulator of cell morphogenesis and NO signaling